MTDYLDEIQARADAATDGPWTVYVNEHGPWVGKDGGAEIGDDPEQDRADAEFSAHARTDVPRLVAALRAVEALPQRPWDERRADDPESRSARAYNSALADVRTAIRDALEPT